ncbi:M28 family peptidase [Tsuneonella amylolytica]|uniref:M28 family peptidase n=1 Tax=Tsuneonella amylolytica TaxID=2338327 RepID=UPI000EAA7B34|nr:M28 family peptidase [Tsuneonella amylolytica]
MQTGLADNRAMRFAPIAAAAAIAVSAPLAASDDPATGVSEARLKSDVERLVGFGTRHTLSDPDGKTRGIGAARRWGAAEFEKTSKSCGGCLTVVLPENTVSGGRIPTPTKIVDVVAIQRGTERPNEVVIVQGHIDSRVTDVMDFTSDAPGANDDGSGTALVLEAARVLSKRQYPVTIVYALLSGEEQGLFGGQLLANYAAEQGWQVKAVLNNDIVGNSCGSDGFCDDTHVRVFSEGPRADLDAKTRADQRRFAGENDSPSRNLSRFIDGLDGPGLEVRPIWRADRMGRGGDHLPFLEKGYPAIRFSVAVENYDKQHQDLRVEDGTHYGDTVDAMDFPYLAKVTALNVRTLDHLARAPMPPVPTADAAVRTDTLIEWKGTAGAPLYNVFARRTDAADWGEPIAIVNYETPTGTRPVTPAAERTHSYVAKVRGDDWIFGVNACAANGACSPVASAVPGGAFEPLLAAEGDK